MSGTDVPDFKALAKDLCEDPASMIYTILLRHKTAELEEWYEQIQRRNRRIRELENLLRRCKLRLYSEDVLSEEINKAINYDET